MKRKPLKPGEKVQVNANGAQVSGFSLGQEVTFKEKRTASSQLSYFYGKKSIQLLGRYDYRRLPLASRYAKTAKHEQ